jgi:ornithine carbamoyltransferase
MTSMRFEEIGRESVQNILSSAQMILESDFSQIPKNLLSLRIIGSFLQGSPMSEYEAVDVAFKKIEKSYIPFSFKGSDTLSSEEVVLKLMMLSKSVDTILASYYDSDTFSEGRILTSKLAEVASVPSISIRDDIYANLSGLAILLGLKQRLGSLENKRIAVHWVFGSRFVAPSVAHSVLSLGAKLGGAMSVFAPDKFPLLRRILKKCESQGLLHNHADMDEDLHSFDAIIPINWCRIEDFSYPERNVQYAAEFKDWYLDERSVSENTLLISEPPIQLDLSVGKLLVQKSSNLTHNWYNLVSSSLLSTIEYVVSNSKELDEPIFLF